MTRLELSSKGQQRKSEMLGELQHQLATHQSSKKRKRVGVGALTLSLACILVLTVNYNWNSNPHSRPEANLSPTHIQPVRTFSFASVEQNRQDVSHRYVTSRIRPSLSVSKMSDEELQQILKDTGDQLVLGEIDGEKMLLPARLSP